MSKNPYTIHNEVLLSASKTAFLIGGNHSVLDYITGKKKPTITSLQNFQKNISSRAYVAKVCDCQYLHVIFPDKQSILQEEFPVKNVVRLGDIYLHSLGNSPSREVVLFPTAKLQSSGTPDVYQKLDTHLSDYGSLLVLEDILDRLGESPREAIEELRSQITIKKKTHGDLGGKLEPKLFQESTHLRTNWNHRHFNSGGTFNNGQVDIYLSPDAPIRKKVLIFGDSFYRLMLPHLSKIFTEVIFLRTPYLHPEMVQLIKPNVILTGNSERYLANVTADVNAPAFQIYSFHHHSQVKPTPLFLHAFTAVTSPSAATSKVFYEHIFNDLSQPKTIVGPSHIVRWGQYLKHGSLERPVSPSDLIGYGGAPVWSKKNLDMVEQRAQQNLKTLLIVADFRFGNEISLRENRDSIPLFISGFSGINAKAINPENDAFMLKRCLKALEAWNNKFNNSIKFIFWDLFCRQVQDRLAARHIADKKYHHPHWNLAPIQAMLPTNRVIDLVPLLSFPMHETMRLFIDGSSHPSLIGYKFIINCFIYETDAVTAYNKAVDDVERELFSVIDDVIKRKNGAVTVVGKSIWLDTILRYLGPSGLEKACRRGLFFLPLNSQIGYGADVKLHLPNHQQSTTIFVSTNGCLTDLTAQDQKTLDSFNLSLHNSTSLSWEANCSDVILSRNETPRSLYGALKPVNSLTEPLKLTDAEVELGPLGYPTMLGLVALLNAI